MAYQGFGSIEEVQKRLSEVGYIADKGLATVVFLGFKMGKPLFLEGEPGVGKTDLAVRLAMALESRLIRLQCYEGIDANKALYEWDYARQLLYIRMHEGESRDLVERGIYDQRFLIKRPLLDAIWTEDEGIPVLLIDEIDRSDEEFEAFLLEVLSDFQVTIPEIGTIKAKNRPFVVITSNRTRDVHDALKRRCFYHWIEYPSLEKEYQIVLKHLPNIEGRLARKLVQVVQRLREMELLKKPGISESLDWAGSLLELGSNLSIDSVLETIGCILKYQEDIQFFKDQAISDKVIQEALSG